jgi:putative peptidoglycan lipid II flippase
MARSSILVMGLFLASKAVGLLRERAIAHAFGAGSEIDAYVAAFKVPDILFTLIAGGALISAFLPVFSEQLAEDEPEEAWRLASRVTNLALLATAILGGLAAIAAPWLVAKVIAPSFAPAAQATTVDLMRILLVSTMIFAVSGVQMGILNAFQHFLSPALAPIVYNLGILAGALVLAPHLGIQGLAWGAVIGAIGHLAVKVPSLLRFGYRWLPVLGLRDPALHQVLRLMGPRVLSLATVQGVNIVNTNLASALPAGSLAAFNYAWVIAQMPQTLLGTAIATVAFPTLAELAARKDRAGLRETASGALAIMLSLSLPAALALVLLGGPAISLLLETGRFDQQAANATLLALRMFALGLVGHVAFELVARLFYAQKDTITVLYLALVALLVNLGLAFVLVGPLAQGGLALANSVAVSVEVSLGLWILQRRLGGLGLRRLGSTLLRASLASLIMAVAIQAALAATGAALAGLGIEAVGGLWIGLIKTGIGGIVGALAFALAAWLLRLEPALWMLAALTRAGLRLRRSA